MKLTNNKQRLSDAKETLANIAKMNIGRYVYGQKIVNRMLAQGEENFKASDKLTKSMLKNISKSTKKNKKMCYFCTINAILKMMGESQATTQEAVKAYKLLFEEELDVTPIIADAVDHYFKKEDFKRERKINFSDGITIPEDAPAEIKDMLTRIKNEFDSKGIGATIEVINLTDNNYGLHPKDFPDFKDFLQAVSNARDKEKEMEEGKSAEEILTESMIHKAETTPEESTKLN
jgi:hypothetical protein